jgi:hypothetical protein
MFDDVVQIQRQTLIATIFLARIYPRRGEFHFTRNSLRAHRQWHLVPSVSITITANVLLPCHGGKRLV